MARMEAIACRGPGVSGRVRASSATTKTTRRAEEKERRLSRYPTSRCRVEQRHIPFKAPHAMLAVPFVSTFYTDHWAPVRELQGAGFTLLRAGVHCKLFNRHITGGHLL